MRMPIFMFLGALVLLVCNTEADISSPTGEPTVASEARTCEISRYRLALDSMSPGQNWRKLEPERPLPKDERDVRSLAYLNPDLHIASINAIHLDWEEDSPDKLAAIRVERWKSIYSSAIFSSVEVASNGHYATFSFIYRRAHGPVRVAHYAYLCFPGVKGSIRLDGEAHIEDGDALEEAFRTVLQSLEVKTL